MEVSSLTKYMLTRSQDEADDHFDKWFVKGGCRKKQIFRQGGVAGTGKTFLIKYLVEKYDLNPSNCLIMAYTGQAVSMLRLNGLYANTIHSSVMHVRECLKKDKEGNVMYRRGIPLTTVEYVPVEFLPSLIKLIIIDESSFLPSWLQDIIVRYRIPIFEIGDPLQLPPVAGEQCFHMGNLDHILLEPMRQSLDSEIYDLATRIREYRDIDPKRYKKDVMFIKSKGNLVKDFDRYMPFFKYSDATLCVTNKQRDMVNELYRKHILKTDSPFPIKGERLICRKNNRRMALGDFQLTNGTMGISLGTTSRSSIDTLSGMFYMDFKPDYIDDDYFDNLACDTEFLLSPAGDKPNNMYNFGNKFEYAHAISTHLSQGSQYDTVLFLGKFVGNREYMMRLNYTAVTRAKRKLMYLLPA